MIYYCSVILFENYIKGLKLRKYSIPTITVSRKPLVGELVNLLTLRAISRDGDGSLPPEIVGTERELVYVITVT